MMAKMTPVLRGVPLLVPGRMRDLRVINAGYMPAKSSWIDHRFDAPAVGLVVSGQGEYRVNEGPINPIKPGSMFAVYPGPTFHYGPRAAPLHNHRTKTTWEEYYVIFKGPGVKRWEQAGWFARDNAVHPLVDLGPLVERFRELIRVIERAGPGDADRALVMTERLLLEMYFSRATVRQAREVGPSVEAVLAHCHENFAAPIHFPTLAQRFAMSYSHLRQQVKKITGVGPHQYLIKLRCEAARRMLSDTDLSLKQIAPRIGIKDPYTFSRTFRRAVGMSPATYREQSAPWSRR